MNIRWLAPAWLSAMLCACVSLPPERGLAQTKALLKTHSLIASTVNLTRTSVASPGLLDEPLDADAAVRVALNRSPRMQMFYAQLGITQAQVYDATRLSNPSLSFMKLTAGDATRTTWSLTQNFTELLFLHYRNQLGRSALLQSQQQVAQSVLTLEAEVRAAYYRYVVAHLVAQLHEQASIGAATAAAYAQSLYAAGTVSELQLSREQANASQARIASRSAQTTAQQRYGDLLTLMGLSMQDNAQFVDRLEVPVQQPLQLDTLQQWANQQRMDLLALAAQVTALHEARTHTRRWFWLGDVQVQAEQEHDTDGLHLRGGGGSVGLPLFNQGGGARLRAQSQWELAQAELTTAQLALNNDLSVQIAALESARLVFEEYRQHLVPLQQRALDLSQQQQHFMLIGTFELLNAKRELLQAYQAYLSATGDYWLQQVELAKTVGGRLPDTAGEGSNGISIGVEALPEAEDNADGQAGHMQSNLSGATP